MVVAEQEDGAAGDDANVVFEPGRISAEAVHPRAVLGVEVLDQEARPFAPDAEVVPRKRFIGDHYVRGFIAANRYRLVPDFPSPGHRAVLIQQT